MKFGVSFLGVLLLIVCCTSQLNEKTLLESTPLYQADVVADICPADICPADMVEINGRYCPLEEQECLHWIDSPGARCEVWKKPVKCLSSTVHKHFCIDRYEYPNKLGIVPQDWMSWNDVKSVCEAQGKRMCTRSEWSFAAEGPDWHPYPYGDGFHRDSSICNFDNTLPPIDIQKVSSPESDSAKRLRSLLVPSGSQNQCVSDFGVHDMAGNIDEWVINETHKPYVSGLMGGHVFGVRNASRPMTDAHNPEFYWYETGGRCCEDSK